MINKVLKLREEYGTICYLGYPITSFSLEDILVYLKDVTNKLEEGVTNIDGVGSALLAKYLYNEYLYIKYKAEDSTKIYLSYINKQKYIAYINQK